MTTPLFRREAREARETSWLGSIVLVRPLSAMLLTGAAGVIAFLILAYLVWGESHNKARVTGFLTPASGLARAYAPQAGVVEARFVSEGDTVAKGTTLLIVVDPRATEDRGSLGAEVASNLRDRQRHLATQRELAGATYHAELRALGARRSRLANDAARMAGEIDAMRTRLRLSQAEVERTRELERSGFVTATVADRKRDEVLDQEIRLSTLERARTAAQREEAAAEAESTVIRTRYLSQLAALDGQRSALQQERLERGAAYRTVVAAPQSGIVASVLADRGQSVTQGATLLTILPTDAKLEAHLFAPSRSVGFVRAGQSVLLRYPAFPAQKFGAQRAQVIAVSRNALPPNELGYAPPDGTREALYRIRVALDAQQVVAYGKPEPLQAGMLVEADILLDRRRIIEWIFDPLLGLAGRA